MLRRRVLWAAVVSSGVLLALGWFMRRSVSRSEAQGPRPGHHFAESFDKLPLGFELNQGQFDSRVAYGAQSSGGTLFFTQEGLTLVLPQFAPGSRRSAGPRSRLRKHPAIQDVVALRLAFDAANPTPEVEAGEQLPGIKNYLIGRDPEEWHTHVPIFGKLTYRDLYPGIDLVFYGAEGRLEYDLNVSPGTDPEQIRFRFEGADRVELDDGDLLIHARSAELRQPRPHVYALASIPRREIPVSYRIDPQGWIGLDVSKHDALAGLRIDPVLAYSTYLGGSGPGDAANSMALDPEGSVYVAGNVTSIDFPTTDGGLEPENPAGGPWGANIGVSAVTKLDPTGSFLVYSTYIGGKHVDGEVGDEADQIVVTDAGLAYVAGQTGAPDFPVTDGSAQTIIGGSQDGYVLELAPEGDRLIYSTFLGGPDEDYLGCIDLDADGNAYVGGFTVCPPNSAVVCAPTHFPTTANALQPSSGGGPTSGIFAKLSPDGTQFLYASYFGGSGSGAYGGEQLSNIEVDAQEQPLLMGYTVSSDVPGHEMSPLPFHDGGGGEVFLTKLTSDGGSQIFFTYLGGSGLDYGWDLKVDSLGDAWVVGQTSSADFPVTSEALQHQLANPPSNGGNGPFDAFITVFDAGGGLLYGTYLGGNGDDRAFGIALDPEGHAHIEGYTSSTDLVTINAIRGEHDESLGLDHAQGDGDYFLADMTVDGGLDFLSYIGGSGAENNILPFTGVTAVDSLGATYFVGSAASIDFPVTSHAFQAKNNAPSGSWNMVVVKIMPPPLPCTLTSLLPNSGSYSGVSVSAQGSNMNAQSELEFGGVPSFIIGATPDQMQVSVGPHACGAVDVTLICPGSPPSTLPDGFTFIGCPDGGPTPDAGPVPDAGPEHLSSGSSCGCGSTGSPFATSAILGMSLLAMARRRRQRRNP